jgi:predicted transcriptional regulator
MEDTQQTREVVKVSVNLPVETLDELRKLAQQRKVSMTQVIKDAIALEGYVAGETANHAQVLIKRPGEATRELLVR